MRIWDTWPQRRCISCCCVVSSDSMSGTQPFKHFHRKQEESQEGRFPIKSLKEVVSFDFWLLEWDSAFQTRPQQERRVARIPLTQITIQPSGGFVIRFLDSMSPRQSQLPFYWFFHRTSKDALFHGTSFLVTNMSYYSDHHAPNKISTCKMGHSSHQSPPSSLLSSSLSKKKDISL